MRGLPSRSVMTVTTASLPALIAGEPMRRRRSPSVLGAALPSATKLGLASRLPPPSKPNNIKGHPSPLPPEPSTMLVLMVGVAPSSLVIAELLFPQMMLLRICGVLLASLYSPPPKPSAIWLPLMVTLVNVGLPPLLNIPPPWLPDRLPLRMTLVSVGLPPSL